ncbi:DUF1186 domain-containing protein [Patescibacteria group bacterium]|nr:DUF1186 domain-containing protein [Patescibacteria group bacterium]
MNKPTFKYPFVNELYKHDFSIDRGILRKILELKEKVIPDLESMLDDVIENDTTYANDESVSAYTPTHALHLLGELQSERSLPTILKILSQPEDFLEFWFSDALTEELWEIVYKCSQNSLDKLEDFLKSNTTYLYARTAVAKGAVQVALYHPGKRKEIIKIAKRAIKATIPYIGKSKKKLNIFGHEIDEAKSYIAFLVSDIDDLEEKSLKPYILDLFDRNLVDTSIIDKESIGEKHSFPVKKEVKSIFDRYDGLERMFNRNEESAIPSVVKNKKVERNKPCPCGSGKKYKKCCYFNQ